MSVVHLWHGHGDIGGTWSRNQCSGETWCGLGGPAVERGVLSDEIDQVTCKICLGIASEFGGACLARLRELSKVIEPVPTVSMLIRLDDIAKSSVTYHAPEVNARRVAQLATVVAELVKHIASKEQP